MALLDTPTADNAPAEIKPIFDTVEKLVGSVPQPTRLLGTSPALLQRWWADAQHFGRHEAFSPALLTHIRLLVAVHGEFPFCIDFNSALLKTRQVANDEELAALIRDPQSARLPEAEHALLQFVLKAARAPEEVSADDVDGLRALGWSDAHILEATYYGGWMLLMGLLFNAFKMHEA